MPITKLVLTHKIPLTVNRTGDILCDVSGIKTSYGAGTMKLKHEPPPPSNTEHEYAFTIVPQKEPGRVYYVAAFSGASLGAMVPWQWTDGKLQSPVFSLDSGKSNMYISVAVLCEVLTSGPVVNPGEPVSLAPAPAPCAGRKHVTSIFIGGDDDLGEDGR